jgi:gamma-D-glutamyl-L-lysine dipeptidyl-peptidase
MMNSAAAASKTEPGHSMIAVLLIGLLIAGCASRPAAVTPSPPVSPIRRLPPLGYTIQAGAFADINNAVRLTRVLQDYGLPAYHFIDETGLYKVRFGNFATKLAAREKADELLAAGILEEVYILRPEEYTAAQTWRYDETELREELVKTAKRFLGVPYQWGGTSIEEGFDCSGLAMVVYQLNGLDLPRSSRQQWQAGQQINRNELRKGDLVFFATAGSWRVSHVGIYTGDGRFLHAPGEGRTIRVATLSNPYFSSRYLGARTYL